MPVKKKIHRHSLPVKTIPVKQVNARLLAVMCALAGFALYINTVTHEYTVDDGTVIKNNKHTTRGIKAIPDIFTSAYRAGFWDRKDGLYRPLSVAMFAVEWQVAPDQPWLGHLVNILLYALTAWVLFNLMKHLLRAHHPLIPFFITLLYIVHPVHTEVVANIKSRDEILCFLFAVISMFNLVKWNEVKSSKYLGFAVIAYIFSIFSKENAITLIAILPLTLWFFTDAGRAQILKAGFSFLGVGIAFLIIRYMVIGAFGGNYELQLVNNSLVGTSDIMHRFSTAVFIMGKYLLLLFFPAKLVFDYSYNTIPIVGPSSIKFLFPLLIYLFLIWIAIRGFLRKDVVSFGIIFFLATISLVSNVLFLIEATMAERFLYMPSLGFCMAVVFFMLKTARPAGKKSLFSEVIAHRPMLILSVVILVFSVRTVARNTDWSSNLNLLSKDVKTSPNSARIRYAYGSAILFEQALKTEEQPAKNNYLIASVRELEKGVGIIENYADAWYNLGIAYKELNDAPHAVAAFEKYRSYRPFKDAEGYIAAGLAYGMNKQYDKAIMYFDSALMLDPASDEALNNKGLYYAEAGKFAESADALNKALAIKPDFYKAYYNLGNTYAMQGDYPTAIKNYQKAIEIHEQYGDAYNNIGNCFSALKNPDSALVYYKKAVATDPSNAKAVSNMGVIYHELGDSINSRFWFEKARSMGM